MSKIEVNTVEPQCGTTLTVGKCTTNLRSGGNNLQAADGGNLISQSGTDITLGASGDTVALASGASQTGFGRTGTVDWDTSIKTGTVTAVTGSGYFVNTTSGGITVNLPAAAVGSIVAVSDYASTSASNNITVTPNGSDKINGTNDDYTISTAGLAVTLVYADATRGWKSVTGSDADATGLSASYVVATGGTPCSGAICGNYKTHTFTGPGTFTVSCAGNPGGSDTVDYLVVGGGGSGGTACGAFGAGAGGAGGFRVANGTSMPAPQTSPLVAPSALTVSATGYPIAVGGGGAGFSSPANNNGNAGVNSTFSTITSAGGGYGAGGPSPAKSAGGPGGSGGGAWGCVGSDSGGTGNTPPTSPPQGNDGGDYAFPAYGGAGGGGAGAVGGDAAAPSTGGVGGVGSYMVQTGFAGCNGTPGPVPGARYFSGGGGGSSTTGSPGGSGGGGKGGDGGTDPGTAGTTNSGGGGGGTRAGTSGAGGSGIVIIRYKFQ